MTDENTPNAFYVSIAAPGQFEIRRPYMHLHAALAAAKNALENIGRDMRAGQKITITLSASRED
jgi:hypothetical protein